MTEAMAKSEVLSPKEEEELHELVDEYTKPFAAQGHRETGQGHEAPSSRIDDYPTLAKEVAKAIKSHDHRKTLTLLLVLRDRFRAPTKPVPKDLCALFAPRPCKRANRRQRQRRAAGDGNGEEDEEPMELIDVTEDAPEAIDVEKAAGAAGVLVVVPPARVKRETRGDDGSHRGDGSGPNEVEGQRCDSMREPENDEEQPATSLSVDFEAVNKGDEHHRGDGGMAEGCDATRPSRQQGQHAPMAGEDGVTEPAITAWTSRASQSFTSLFFMPIEDDTAEDPPSFPGLLDHGQLPPAVGMLQGDDRMPLPPSRVNIKPHPSASPEMKAGLHQLLLHQKDSPHYLQLQNITLLHVLDLGSQDCFRGLKTLKLWGSRYCIKDPPEALNQTPLVQALSCGWLGSLEELDLGDALVGDAVIRGVLAALGAGKCPLLRRLSISFDLGGGGAGEECAPDEALARALRLGRCQHLDELRLAYGRVTGRGLLALAEALQRGACPQLRKLDLERCRIEGDRPMRGLVRAIQSGGLAQLEDMNLRGLKDIAEEEEECKHISEKDWVPVMVALSWGECPLLKHLRTSGASPRTIQALAEVFTSASLPHLETLEIAGTIEYPPTVFGELVTGMTQGGLPALRRLELNRLHEMGADEGQILGEAIGWGTFTNLEELCLTICDGLDSEGAKHIFSALEMGGCPNLTRLDIHGIAEGPGVGQALARALSSGNLSRLQECITGLCELGDQILAEVVVGLKRCPRMVRIDLGDLGLPGTPLGPITAQSLLQGLRENAWPELEELVSRHFLPDEAMVMELAQVLEEGRSCTQLRVLGVPVQGQGAERLLVALERGVCPRLCDVTVEGASTREEWRKRLKERRGLFVGSRKRGALIIPLFDD